MIRLIMTRYRWASSTPSMRLKWAMFLLVPFGPPCLPYPPSSHNPLVLVGTVCLHHFVLLERRDLDVRDSIDLLIWPYFALRLLVAFATEMFPFSPVIAIKDSEDGCMRKCKGLRKRYMARIGFLFILTVTSAVYEWFLIVPAINTLIETPYVRLLLLPFPSLVHLTRSVWRQGLCLWYSQHDQYSAFHLPSLHSRGLVCDFPSCCH